MKYVCTLKAKAQHHKTQKGALNVHSVYKCCIYAEYTELTQGHTWVLYVRTDTMLTVQEHYFHVTWFRDKIDKDKNKPAL